MIEVNIDNEGEENNKETEVMDIKSRGSQTEMRRGLEEEIGGDEHAQGNDDDDL